MNKTILTPAGLENLKKELEDLKTNRRKEIAEKLKRALEQGDLSENAEYAEAKEQQAFLEGKIAELELKIKNVEIIKEGKKKRNVVGIGSTIKIKFDGHELVYTIVGSSEANPSRGLISNESPIGKAFLGHKIGDEVEVKTPKGLVKYRILEIK